MSEKNDLRERVKGEISHHISPVIGWLRLDATKGLTDEDGRRHESWLERLDKAAESIAEMVKPRTVTTVEELRALKLPAIIDSPAGGPARVDYYAGPVRQQRYVESLFADDESGDECYSPEYFATFGLPATVLHEGSRA